MDSGPKTSVSYKDFSVTRLEEACDESARPSSFTTESCFEDSALLDEEAHKAEPNYRASLRAKGPRLESCQGIHLYESDVELDCTDLKALLEKAQSLLKEGIARGVYGAKIDDATMAFLSSRVLCSHVLESENSTIFLRGQAREVLVRVWIHEAELNLVLFRFKEVKAALWEAVAHHKILVDLQKSAAAQQHTPFADCMISASDLAVLEADIMRCFSVVDYRLGDDGHKTWDEKGTALLQKVLHEEPNHTEAKSLLSLFLSYRITTGDVDGESAVEDCVQAIDWLGDLYEQHSESPNHELHSRRLSVVLRLASYAFREVGRFEEATEAVKGALDIIKVLCNQRPRAVIHLFELYHCNCALAEHLEQSDDDDRFILDARIEAAAALTSLTELLPEVPKFWRSLTQCLIDVADLQERGGLESGTNEQLEPLPLQTSSRAVEAAVRCISCASTPSFEDYVEYSRALLERGRHSYIRKLYLDASEYYERALEVYKSSILTSSRAQRDDEFYIELVLRSMQTASNCALSGKAYDKAMYFLSQARHVGGNVQLRKNKVLYASILVDLARLHYSDFDSADAIEVLGCALEPMERLRKLHPWHVTINTLCGDARLLLAKCHQRLGNQILEVTNRKLFLTYAAQKHGRDYAPWTNKAQIGDLEEDKLHKLRDICERDVPEVKRYRLPVRKSGQLSWIAIEIASAIPERDPLADSARVLKEDFGVEIADDLRESFRKLHELAIRNNVALTELCDYALSPSSPNSRNTSDDEGTVTTAGETTIDSLEVESRQDSIADSTAYSSNSIPRLIAVDVGTVNDVTYNAQ